MFWDTAFLHSLGDVPPPPPVVAGAITLVPANPGDLGTPPQAWTTNVQVQGGGSSQVKWFVGVNGQKIVTVNRTTFTPSAAIPNFNAGDTIDFTGFGTGFALVRQGATGNLFLAGGSLGVLLVTIPNETDAARVSYLVDGAGGTSKLAYTVLNLTNGAANLTVNFWRPGDSLIVRSLDETKQAISGQVSFSGAITRTISLVPEAPGDLGTAPANWTTTITAVGMTQVKYSVFSNIWDAYTTPAWTVLDLVNGSAQLTVEFPAVGDRLQVKSVDDAIVATSQQVTFGGGTQSITLSPLNPGDLGTAPKNWTTEITAVGMAQVKWAVFDANFASSMSWQVVDIAATKATITATFNAAGDRVIVKSMDDLIERVSGQVSFGTVVTPPPPAQTNDYLFIQDFLAPLTTGPNIERTAGKWLSRAYFDKLKTDGATHVRLFCYSAARLGFITNEDFAGYLSSMKNAVAAGLKVFIDLMDFCYMDDLQSTGAVPYLTRVSKEIAAANFDNRMIAVGAVNEYVPSNTQIAPYHRSFTAAIRAELPGYLIIVGPGDWGGSVSLTNGTLQILADKRVVYQWHDYDYNAELESACEAAANRVYNWAQANDVFTVCGEWGKGPPDGSQEPNPGIIPTIIQSAGRKLGRERPMFWTITNGSWWRMNQSGNLDLTAANATEMREARDLIKTKDFYYVPGTVSEPTPTPAPGTGTITTVDIIHRGQSNAAYADEYGAPTVLKNVVQSVAGVTVNMVSRRNQASNNTLHGGTYSYWNSPYDSDPRWLNAGTGGTDYAAAPSTWTNQTAMTEAAGAATAYVSADQNVPLIDFSLHWEYDLRMDDAARTYYREGEREIGKRILAARPKATNRYIRAYGYCPYESGEWPALNTINNAWGLNFADAALNSVMACGNMMDAYRNTTVIPEGDNSHWGDTSGPRIYARIGFAMARQMWNRGWLPAALALDDCPSYGPGMQSAARNPANSNSVIVTCAHDKGTALVAGAEGIDWAAFHYTSNGGSPVYATGGAILTANTFRVDFAVNLPSTTNEKLFYCLHPRFRERRLIRDNWHVVRPAKYASVPNIADVEFPLQRNVAGVSF